MQTKIETGLFFGSFNPIHIGHLIIANHLLHHTHLEKIWFVVSPQNPLKQRGELFNEAIRVELVELATEDNPGFEVCLRELQLERPSYSCKTIEVLQHEHPDHSFTLIIGSDNLEVFAQWKDHDQILRMVPLMVYPRKVPFDSPFTHHPGVRLVKAPLLEISSTMIRESIRHQKDIRYLVPEKVYRKIVEGILNQ